MGDNNGGSANQTDESLDRLSDDEAARVSAALELGRAQETAAERSLAEIAETDGHDAANQEFISRVRAVGGEVVDISKEAGLEHLKEQRDSYNPRKARRVLVDDPDFSPYQDCDAIFAAGTKVLLSGVTVILLIDVPVEAPTLRDDAVLAEHLAESGNIGVNAGFLRGRYNGNGALVGVNESHPLNRLDAQIEALQLEVDERAARRAEAEDVTEKPVEDSQKAE
jgi:hypothetical protein